MVDVHQNLNLVKKNMESKYTYKYGYIEYPKINKK